LLGLLAPLLELTLALLLLLTTFEALREVLGVLDEVAHGDSMVRQISKIRGNMGE
jgi:hypothetical protein